MNCKLRNLFCMVLFILITSCNKYVEHNNIQYSVVTANPCTITWLDNKGYHTIKTNNGVWGTCFDRVNNNYYLNVVGKGNIDARIYSSGRIIKVCFGKDSVNINY